VETSEGGRGGPEGRGGDGQEITRLRANVWGWQEEQRSKSACVVTKSVRVRQAGDGGGRLGEPGESESSS